MTPSLITTDALRPLPTFAGYTVDVRLNEFRIVRPGHYEFVPFTSPKGYALITAMDDLVNEMWDSLRRARSLADRAQHPDHDPEDDIPF